MIPKDRFVKYIKGLERLQRIEDKINEAAFELEFFSFNFPEYQSLVVGLLEELFPKDIKNQWISYFIYELDYGKQWHKDSVIETNGKIVKLSKPEELYDFLVRNEHG